YIRNQENSRKPKSSCHGITVSYSIAFPDVIITNNQGTGSQGIESSVQSRQKRYIYCTGALFRHKEKHSYNYWNDNGQNSNQYQEFFVVAGIRAILICCIHL